jgi:soluble lytic murein transglycosylase-like protein
MKRMKKYVMLLCLWMAGGVSSVFAGAQQYEPMAEGVRLALKNAIDDAQKDDAYVVPGDSHYQRAMWLSKRSSQLTRYIQDEDDRIDFLLMVRYEALRAGLSPDLVLAVIHVESRFNAKAKSHVGARGLMQVMPFWTRVLGDSDAKKLFHIRTNLRYGCTILRHYLDVEGGDVIDALARYNGSLGRTEYPRLVFNSLKNWQ